MKYERLTDKNRDWFEFTEITDSEIYKRLQELEDKIENGTLIELPYKVGDTVFLMAKLTDRRYIGDYFVVENMGFDKFGFYIENERGIFRKHNIFPTKADAEAKLKELKGY